MPGDRIEPRRARRHPKPHRRGGPLFDLPQPGEQLLGRRRHQLGRLAGRQRADVGHQVGERHVDLVADGRDDRDPRGEDGADHHLFVERPEVFEAAAAAGDHQAVDRQRQAVGHADGGGDLLGRALALHAGGQDQHVGPAPAAAQDLEEIVDGRPRGAGDQSHPPHQPRQRPLPRRVEEPLAGQLLPQLPQGQLQGPHPLGLDLVDDQLVAAAGRIHVEVSLADHFQAVGQLEPHPRGDVPPDGRANLGPLVLERQIAMARLRPRQVRDLAAHPDRREGVFQQVLDLRGQLVDRQDRRRLRLFGE